MIPASVNMLSIGFYSPQQIEGAIHDIFGVDSQLIEDHTYYTAWAGDVLVGCGGWSRRRTLFGGDQMKGEVDDLLDPKTEAARIRAFFVDPAWARRGIGRRIMETCERDAQAAGFTRMALVATLPGEQLYKVFGFQEEKRYSLSLSNGEALPVVSMTKTLVTSL